MHRLEPLFTASSVAVVGASDSSSYGLGPYRALTGLGFTGTYYPVNPRRAEVNGLPAYPDIASLPGPIDLGVIVVGRDLVLPAVAACADRGARAVVVISAGFVEADAHGAALQQALSALARERDLLLVGPNCFGAASIVHRTGGFTGSGLERVRQGGVGVTSNSGGLLNEVISYGGARGIGFSHLISTGNEAGVTAADVLDFFVDDPHTQVILAILETVRDPALFLAAVERAARARKPIVALKLGASERAARSALTHTGALAGSDAVYSALFRQKGVLRVADLDDLVEVGSLLGAGIEVLRRRPLERAAVIEISGGGTGLVSDSAEAAGLGLPDLSSEAAATLRSHLPRGVEASNPLDTGLTWGAPEMAAFYPLALRTLAAEPAVDVVVSRFTVPREGDLGPLRTRLDEMLAAAAEHPDRLFAVLSRTSDRVSDAWAAAVAESGLVFLQGYGRGLRALGRAAEYSRFLRRQTGHAAAPAPSSLAALSVPRPSDGRATLTEVESKALLAAAGLPVLPTVLAASADEAVAYARSLGFPVAAKVVSPEIVHKSDVGGVRLGLADEAAVRAAFADLAGVAAAQPGATFEGVAIQPMAEPGVELVIGAHRDPQFGPVVLFGLGGVFVEALGDVALRVAPLARADAEAMLDEVRGRALLHGARGRPPVARAALVDALCRLGDLLLAQPAIASVDLNPVLGYADRVVAVDARVELAAPAAQPPAAS